MCVCVCLYPRYSEQNNAMLCIYITPFDCTELNNISNISKCVNSNFELLKKVRSNALTVKLSHCLLTKIIYASNHGAINQGG